MQPCKTGDQPYSDASPNSECSLTFHLLHIRLYIKIFKNHRGQNIPIVLLKSKQIINQEKGLFASKNALLDNIGKQIIYDPLAKGLVIETFNTRRGTGSACKDVLLSS